MRERHLSSQFCPGFSYLSTLKGQASHRGPPISMETDSCHIFPLEVPALEPRVHHASTELNSFVKLLFRNLPHISLCIYIHIITTWALLLESYAHSAGLWAAERFCTRSGYSSSAEKCRDQHSSSRTVQHRWEGPGLPPGRHYVQGWGRLGRGPCTIAITSTKRPTPKG